MNLFDFYTENKFNKDYIRIYTSLIHIKYLECLYNNNKEDHWTALYESLHIFAKKHALDIDSIIAIEIKKDSEIGKIITKEVPETKRSITADEVIKAIIIATYEGNIKYATILSNIIISGEFTSDTIEYEKFSQKYGKDITNFILDNNNIKEYQKMINGSIPYEFDRHVFLYEDGEIKEVDLPTPTKSKLRRREMINN